jgi:hypothetical protein
VKTESHKPISVFTFPLYLSSFWPFPPLFCQTILLRTQILPTFIIKQLAKIFPKAKRKLFVNNFLNNTQTKNPDL